MYKRNNFKRGAMTFDDFNYHQYNKFILVDPDNPNACESTETDEE